MESQVTRLAIDGQWIRFERATLVEFLGWRLLLVGAALEDGGTEIEVPIELTVSGSRYVGTVRTSALLQPTGRPARGRQTVLRGVGALRRPWDPWAAPALSMG
jgi:hypothetical protein